MSLVAWFLLVLTGQPYCQAPWRPINARPATRKRWRWNAHLVRPSSSNTLSTEERECTVSANATRLFPRWLRGTSRRITRASGRNQCRYVSMKFSHFAQADADWAPRIFEFIEDCRECINSFNWFGRRIENKILRRLHDFLRDMFFIGERREL